MFVIKKKRKKKKHQELHASIMKQDTQYNYPPMEQNREGC